MYVCASATGGGARLRYTEWVKNHPRWRRSAHGAYCGCSHGSAECVCALCIVPACHTYAVPRVMAQPDIPPGKLLHTFNRCPVLCTTGKARHSACQSRPSRGGDVRSTRSQAPPHTAEDSVKWRAVAKLEEKISVCVLRLLAGRRVRWRLYRLAA